MSRGRFYSSYKGSDEGKADGQTQLKNKSRDEANSREARGTTRMPLPNAKPQSAIDLKRSFTVSQRNKRQQSKWRSDHLQSAVKLFLCIFLAWQQTCGNELYPGCTIGLPTDLNLTQKLWSRWRIRDCQVTLAGCRGASVFSSIP